jgi:hypothetical protein
MRERGAAPPGLPVLEPGHNRTDTLNDPDHRSRSRPLVVMLASALFTGQSARALGVAGRCPRGHEATRHDRIRSGGC